MQPINELLARFRWDANFARGRIEIGYWDRVACAIQRIGLGDVLRDAENPSLFTIVDEEGTRHSIPLHRVRKVWRDGVLIWDRDPASGRGEP